MITKLCHKRLTITLLLFLFGFINILKAAGQSNGDLPVSPEQYGLDIPQGSQFPPAGTRYDWLNGNMNPWGGYMYDVEPQRGVFYLDKVDDLIQLALSHGKHHLILTTDGPPQWAARYPTQIGFPGGPPGSASPFADIQDYVNYVRAVADRVANNPACVSGQMEVAFIGRNECYCGINFSNDPHYQFPRDTFFKGTPDDLAAEQRALYRVAHQEYGFEVLSPSFNPSQRANPSNSGMPVDVDDFISRAGPCFDYLACHFYSWTGPEGMIPDIQGVQQVLAKHNINVPIWDTENGLICMNRQTARPLIGALVSRYITISTCLGVAKFFWNMWDVPAGYSDDFYTGFLSEGGVPTAGAGAWNRTIGWLVDKYPLALTNKGGVYTATLKNTSGTNDQIVWNTSGTSNYTVPDGFQYKQDLDGNSSGITPGGSVTIGPSPILISQSPIR